MPAALPADWSAIRALAVAGHTLEELSESTGIALGTLKARSAREGWKGAVAEALSIRDAQVQRAVASGQMKRNATDATMVAADTEAQRSLDAKSALGKAIVTGSEHLATQNGEFVLKSARALKELAGAGGIVFGWGSESGSGRISIFGSQVAIVEQSGGGVEQA